MTDRLQSPATRDGLQPKNKSATYPAASERASYLKTAAVALASTLILLVVLVAGATVLPPPWRLLVPMLLAPAAAASSLVFAGGLVVLHRDDLERRKLPDPFYRHFSRDPTGRYRGWRRWLRPLLGPALRPGDAVRLRSPREILATLDATGCCNGLPFMPEMLALLGQDCVVDRRIDKINDWMGGNERRRTRQLVTLVRARCNGQDHGGCQAGCQILWSGRWLRQVPRNPRENEESAIATQFDVDELAKCVRAAATRSHVTNGVPRTRYMCQITELVSASQRMSVWDIRQDIRPALNGNLSFAGYAIAILTMLFRGVQKLRGGVDFPVTAPMLPQGPTPTVALNLKAGEWVEVRDKVEIGLTLYKAHNRGMWFGRETLRFCNQRYRVQRRVEQIIHERSGAMIRLGSPAVILEQVCSSGEFHRLCPQNEYVFWREIWLKRAASNDRHSRSIGDTDASDDASETGDPVQ